MCAGLSLSTLMVSGLPPLSILKFINQVVVLCNDIHKDVGRAYDERCDVQYEDKLTLLQIPRNRGWYNTILRCGDRSQ